MGEWMIAIALQILIFVALIIYAIYLAYYKKSYFLLIVLIGFLIYENFIKYIFEDTEK